MQITNGSVFPGISINDNNIVSVIGVKVTGSVFNWYLSGRAYIYYPQESNLFSSALAKGCALKVCIIGPGA